MRYFFSEESIDYNNYKFGYSVNLELDEDDSIEECFHKGFLPFTGDINNENEVYYMARSLRVNLNLYKRISENLRVIKNAKKNQIISFTSSSKNSFKHDMNFKKFCLEYSNQRFINNPLTNQRLDLILKRNNYNRIYTFTSNNKILGYVLAYENINIIHYWFSFYNTSLLDKFHVGKYMMEQIIYHAKENNKKYVYLGTCYGEKSLYKVRDFKGIEFFDGSRWTDDINNLKSKCKNDII